MASNRLYVFSLLVLFACVVVVSSAPKKPKKSAAKFQEALENTVVWLMSVRAEELALFARNEEEPPFDIKSSLKKKLRGLTPCSLLLTATSEAQQLVTGTALFGPS